MAGTVTLLFTDLVGSTELLGRLGEAAAAEHRRRHFAALREAITEAGGSEVKNLGDGLMVAFSSAAAAVCCAQEMQRSVAAQGEATALRIGLHAGEPAREDEDYFGTPVVVASRLCDRAAGGQILVSDLVRGLVGTQESMRFRSLGPLVLKGLSVPVPTWEAVWDGDAAEPPPTPASALLAPLPEPIGKSSTAFVGRDPALAQLRAALVSAGDGARLAAIGGEPGVGKTRLASEFAATAHAEGAVVLFGRCDEQALVPYQPFAEAIRAYLTAVPAAAPLAQGLERLTGAGGRPLDRDADPSTERLALFDAVVVFLSAIGRAGPLVVLLDDLHWADGPTLALTRHLVRSREASGLVVATYRETELSRRHPLAEVLAELRRDRLVERVPLGGLTAEDVSGLLAAEGSGHVPPRGFVEALHAETEGNPFFIEEILRHLVETGTIVERDGRWTSDRAIEDMAIPEGVREAVGRRLAGLSDTANRALAEASVLGRSFEFDVLVAMSAIAEDDLLDALDEALRTQLIVEDTNAGAPAYAFRHALVRETLYEELSMPRRQRLHLRAADAIQARRAREPDAQAPVLALHLRNAGGAADSARTIEWTLRAAAWHATALAWEEAETQLESALEVMEDADAPQGDRARVLERLADLCYVTNSDPAAGIRRLEEALAGYEQAGMAERAARVHSRLGRDLSSSWGPTMDIPKAREHMQAAEAVLGTEAPEVAVGMLNLAWVTVSFLGLELDSARAASRRAVRIAESLGRPLVALNAEVLDAWMAVMQGELEAVDRLDLAWHEADRRNHPWLAFVASWSAGPAILYRRGGRELGAWLSRELERPRGSSSAGQQRMLRNFRSQAYSVGGDLALAAAEIAAAPFPEFPIADLVLATYRDGGERARGIADSMIEEARRAGSVWTEAVVLAWRAGAQAAVGDFAAAVRDGCGAIEMWERGGIRGIAAAERAQIALRSIRAGDVASAQAHVEVARRTITDERWEISDTTVRAAEAGLAASAGRTDEADLAFARAVEELDAAGNLMQAAEVRRAWGVLLGRTEPLDAALARYAEAGAAACWTETTRAERDRVSAGAPA